MTERDNEESVLILTSRGKEDRPVMTRAVYYETFQDKFGNIEMLGMADGKGQSFAMKQEGWLNRRAIITCKDPEGGISTTETSTRDLAVAAKNAQKVAASVLNDTTYKYGVTFEDIKNAFHTLSKRQPTPTKLAFPVEGASPMDTFCADPTIREIRNAGSSVGIS